jgi:hypothetical protein
LFPIFHVLLLISQLPVDVRLPLRAPLGDNDILVDLRLDSQFLRAARQVIAWLLVEKPVILDWLMTALWLRHEN